MDLEDLIILSLIIIGGVWAFWLIFKRDLMQNQVGKLLSYFMGVIVTLLLVMAMVAWFLPWWAAQLIENTNDSTYVKQLQEVSTDLWGDIGNGDVTVRETEQPGDTGTPAPTVSPLPTQESQGQTIVGCSGRIHKVAAGENLYRISIKYGTTVAAIKACNPTIPANDTIYVGQELTLP